MPLRSCIVSFLDTDGLRHSCEVQAETLYEAAALALPIFRDHDCSPGSASTLEVEIRTSVVHALPIPKVKRWSESTPKSPKEAILKNSVKGKYRLIEQLYRRPAKALTLDVALNASECVPAILTVPFVVAARNPSRHRHPLHDLGFPAPQKLLDKAHCARDALPAMAAARCARGSDSLIGRSKTKSGHRWTQ